MVGEEKSTAAYLFKCKKKQGCEERNQILDLWSSKELADGGFKFES